MEFIVNIPDAFAEEVISVNAARFKANRSLALRNASLPETDLNVSDQELVAKGVAAELLKWVRDSRAKKAVQDFDASLGDF